MRYVIVGPIIAVGTFPTKQAAREYLALNYPGMTTAAVMALLPPVSGEQGQLIPVAR